MSLLRKLKSYASEKHCNAESDVHARHVAIRKKKRQISWVPLPKEDVIDSSIFALNLKELGLKKGEAFCHFAAGIREIEGKELEALLAGVRRKKSFYFQTRKLKSGELSKSRRKRPNPLSELTVSLSPAQSLFLQKLSESEIRQKMRGLIPGLSAALVDATGWCLEASSIHYDGSRPHLNFYITRVKDDNTLTGAPRLRTLGPWSVGQWRLFKIGAGDEFGNQRLKDNLENFIERHGEGIEPLDLKLHRLLDEAFKSDLSASEQLRLEKCQEQHANWKTSQRVMFTRKKNGVEQLGWSVFYAAYPHFCPAMQAALKGVQVLTTIIRILQKASSSDDNPTFPSLSASKFK